MSHQFHMTISESMYAVLRAEADRSDLPMAELVRRAVDAVYRPSRRRRLRGYEFSLTVAHEPDSAVVGRRVAPRVPGRPLYAREM